MYQKVLLLLTFAITLTRCSYAQQPLMQTFLQRPNYRGLLLNSNTQPLQAAIELGDLTSVPSPLQVDQALLNASDVMVASASSALQFTTARQQVQLPLNALLPNGDYQWTFTLKGNGQVLQTLSQPVHVVSNMPTTYIDETGRVVRNGSHFFPFGIYLGEAGDDTDNDMERIADAGFNTVLNYRYGYVGAEDATAFLDRAQNHDLSVIFSLKDLYQYNHPAIDGAAISEDLIDDYKDHPALLAWYINDEAPLSAIPELLSMYQRVQDLDPDHPTYSVHFQKDNYPQYFPTTDVFGSDWYPYGWSPWSGVTTYARAAKTATRDALGMWTVTQIHNGTLYNGGNQPQNPVYTPTVTAMKNFAYQAIASGANGLIFYSYFDLWYDTTARQKSQTAFDARWPGVEQVAQEISSYIPVLEDGQDIPIVVSASGAPARGILYNNKMYLFIANSTWSALNFNVQIPGSWTLAAGNPGQTSPITNGTQWIYAVPANASGVIVFE